MLGNGKWHITHVGVKMIMEVQTFIYCPCKIYVFRYEISIYDAFWMGIQRYKDT